jgi:glycosyltransferase involved in cell wall biosynthesis
LTRVLFLTESFHPVLGGGESHILSLGAALAAAGDGALVVTRRTDASWPAEETVRGIRVARVAPSGLGPGRKYRMVGPALRAVRRLRADYDVLVVRGTRLLGLPGLVAARAAGRPVVLQAELNGEMTGEVYTWGKPWAEAPLGRAVRGAARLRNGLLRDADAFVAMSRRIAAEFEAAGVEPGRIALIPHGVDLAHFRPASREEREALRARLRLPAGACVIAYSGRLLRGKGLQDLVAAFARIVPARDVHLLLLGSGDGQSLSVEEALKDQVRAAGLESRVTFAGRVSDVAGWLRASDVFAFPSVFEALGIALVEGAACGLPAVGAKTGGIVDVIEDGVSGRLVAPGDVAGLAAALAALADRPQERAAMGREARRVAEGRFDHADMVVRYRTLFGELASRRRLGLPRWPAAGTTAA